MVEGPLEPGGWVPLARWRDGSYAAVFYVNRDAADDVEDPEDEYFGLLEVFFRDEDAWDSTDVSGSSFIDPFAVDPELLAREVVLDSDRLAWHRGETTVQVIGGICAPIVMWIEVEQDGSRRRFPVDGAQRSFVVGARTPPAATVRFLDANEQPIHRGTRILEWPLEATDPQVLRHFQPSKSVRTGEWHARSRLAAFASDQRFPDQARALFLSRLDDGVPIEDVFREVGEVLRDHDPSISGGRPDKSSSVTERPSPPQDEIQHPALETPPESDSDSAFLSPVGFVRIGGTPMPDEELQRALLNICEHNNLGVPDDLAQSVLTRIRQGDPPRIVGAWLIRELEERSLPTGLIGWLLDDS